MMPADIVITALSYEDFLRKYEGEYIRLNAETK